MNRFVFLLVAMAASFCVSATETYMLRTDQPLTSEQRAKLEAEANHIASEAVQSSIPKPDQTAERVKEWASVGEAVGTGMVAAAKQLGIAANEFATTPVGRFTMFLIAWHFLANTLLHLFGTILWAAITIPITLYIYRTTVFNTTIEEYEKGKGPNGKSKVIIRTRREKAKYDDLGPGLTAIICGAFSLVIFMLMVVTL